jgi:hypothetical protein
MTEDTHQPTEAADVQPEAVVPEMEQPTTTEVAPVEKPKPKRYVKKKVAPPVLTQQVADQRAPTPEEPVAPPEPPTSVLTLEVADQRAPPEPPTVETPIPQAKPKAKPRVKKVVAKHMVIDTVDVQPITQETQEPTIVTEPEVVTEAHTTQDTRTPHQRLSDMQQQMKKLRKEAKQVNYKRMLEGKI